jgi:HSP20 family molecular chaperone IbpA
MATAPVVPVIEPSVDGFSQDSAFTLIADLPGVRAGDLALRLEGRVLVLEARGAAVHYRRTFALRAPVDEERLSASLREGVLTLTLPRPAPPAARAIPVVEA